MANDYQKSALEGVSDKDLAEVLHRLVAKNPELAEAADAELNQLRSKTAERVKVSSLTPKQEQKFLKAFKVRFDAHSQLHGGIDWNDVERALKAAPEAMRKLYALDEKGHAMTVFGDENGELIFVSGWNNYEDVSEDHRYIVCDSEAQSYVDDDRKCNGNAMDIVKALGVDLADPEFHEKLRNTVNINGWASLKTDSVTRKRGYVFEGNDYGFGLTRVGCHPADYRSFRAALRVKKV